MDVKRFIRLTHFKYIGFVLLPLIFGMIYSFYKFDMIRFGTMFLFVPAILTGLVGLMMLKALMEYRYADTDAEISLTLVEKLQISLDSLRHFMWGNFTLSIILMIAVALFTTPGVIIFYGVLFVISLMCVVGKYALIRTPFSELILSLLLGFLLPLMTIYTNVFNEQKQFFPLFMEGLLVCLPFILSLFILVLAYHLSEETENTLAMKISSGMADGIMELFTFLAYALPMFYIYLNYTSWTMLLIWLIFPKAWLDIKRFENDNYSIKEFKSICEAISATMALQSLLYMLGLFF